jgi:hypothetical protein
MDPPYPLMEEYDFRKDSKNPAMTIALKPTNKVRPTVGSGLDSRHWCARAGDCGRHRHLVH